MMTRTGQARDWDTGHLLSSHLLGSMSRLEVHHIFPKDLLYKAGYDKSDVNALANFTFLTKETNLYVTNKNPAEYIEEFEQKNPGAVATHWIPMDRELWKVENYHDFLAARRELLAEAANKFLEELSSGIYPETEESTAITKPTAPISVGGISSEDEESRLIQYNQWVVDQGLPEGEFLYEILTPENNELVAIIDLAWPSGLQEGLSQPVALLIDEGKDTEEAANKAGYLFFTNFDDFKQYVKMEIKPEVTNGAAA
jgi:hypothetical protein